MAESSHKGEKEKADDIPHIPLLKKRHRSSKWEKIAYKTQNTSLLYTTESEMQVSLSTFIDIVKYELSKYNLPTQAPSHDRMILQMSASFLVPVPCDLSTYSPHTATSYLV